MDLSPDCAAALAEQERRERANALAYRGLASAADLAGYGGSVALFDRAADEEAEHAARILAHLRARNAAPVPMLPPDTLALPSLDSLQDYYAAADALERANTAALRPLFAMALADADAPAMALLSGLLVEQMESEKELDAYVRQLMDLDAAGERLWDAERMGR